MTAKIAPAMMGWQVVLDGRLISFGCSTLATAKRLVREQLPARSRIKWIADDGFLRGDISIPKTTEAK